MATKKKAAEVFTPPAAKRKRVRKPAAKKTKKATPVEVRQAAEAQAPLDRPAAARPRGKGALGKFW